MLLLDKPYVSDLLTETLHNLCIPILNIGNLPLNAAVEQFVMQEDEFFRKAISGNQPILCNSEDAYRFIQQHMADYPIGQAVSLFKDKGAFRQLMNKMYPDFFYRIVNFEKLDQLLLEAMSYPIVIKPLLGYSSIGVHIVMGPHELLEVIQIIKQDMEAIHGVYPESVINSRSFLVEEMIQGEEYAIDAFFTADGEPVILNMFKRMFVDERDTSDRIYFTGKSVIQEIIEPARDFLEKLGELMDLRSFPLHFEVRLDKEGKLVPIEVNPLRFAGIGTTELGVYAYDINVYEYFFNKIKPNWKQKLAAMDDGIYSFFCAEFRSSLLNRIDKIDHANFIKHFNGVMEYRRMPYREYPVFSVVFYRNDNQEDNRRLMELNLESFLLLKDSNSMKALSATY